MNNWHGLMEIEYFRHHDVNGNIIYEEKNIKNLLHNSGEEFLLRCAFVDGYTDGVFTSIIPTQYYLGLDNRTNVTLTDTMASISGEPVSNGYLRQAVSSRESFVLDFVDNHYLLSSPIVAFQASSAGFGWGPANRLFLTTSPTNSGFLISTATLSIPIQLTPGQSATVKYNLKLNAC